jgi:hypothetical protein
MSEIAEGWVNKLRARGVTVAVRNNRLWLCPASAYQSLSDDEILTLRHHRGAIKAIAAGLPSTPSAPSVHGPSPSPAPAPAPSERLSTYSGAEIITLADWKVREEIIKRQKEAGASRLPDSLVSNHSSSSSSHPEEQGD